MNDKATILVVDDTPTALALMVNTLTAEGYRVRPADSGELALVSVAAHLPDLILLDVRMPVMDGFEVCRRLKERAESRDIPVIFITASVEQAQRVEGLKLGAVDFITKPIQHEELLARVQTHLELRRTRVQLEQQAAALRQANAQLQAEIAGRQHSEEELRQSLDRAERSRRAMLSALEDRQRIEAALAIRANQQAVVAELGQFALVTTALQSLFDRAAARVAETFEVEYCKVLELLPDGSAVKLAAGVGWRPGLVGVATVGIGRDSQAGYTLLTDQPVIVEDLRSETRFSGPSLLRDHGVVSGISVIIPGPDRPFGVLGAHTIRRRAFTPDDVHFFRAVANVLAEAIQRRQIEETLVVERTLLRTLVENLPDATYVKDRAGRKTLANPADVRKIGAASEAEVLGKTDFELYPLDLATAFDAGDQLVLATGQPILNREERITQPDGSEGWQLTSKVPLYDSAGQIIGLVGIGHDITERKRAEAERTGLLMQVQAQAQQIAQLIDTVPEGVLLLDAAGRVVVANPAGARALALLAGAAIGQVLTRLGDLSLAELLATAQRDAPWRELRTDSRIFEAIVRPISTVETGAGQWVLVINDVTEMRQMQRQLEQQERLAAVGQLAAGIAHDFNNILAIIALHVPLLAGAPGLGDRDRERLTIIGEQTGHATRLVQQLLDFSRRAVIERRPLDLAPLLREQVKLLARTLPETIHVTLECAPGEFVVLADPTRLQQAVMNLATNARDAMPGGGALRLSLTRVATPGRPDLSSAAWVRLEITDSGVGIPLEAQAHIFEPFFTTKPRGQGTGLGLAQVHGIVKQHDGEIEVRSTPGRGAIFSIYLPAIAAAATPVTAAAAEPQTGGGQTILLVEDNPALLMALSDTVEMLGYDVLGAANGAEALAVLEARGAGIALVLSDLIMPVMGGEALLRAMRARGLCTPVAILSGYPLEGELENLKPHGLAGWLLKPPALDALARLVAQALAAPGDL